MNIFTPPTLPLIDPGRTFSADCLIWTNAYSAPFVGWYADRSAYGLPNVWFTYTPTRQAFGNTNIAYQASCDLDAVQLAPEEVHAWAYVPAPWAVEQACFHPPAE